MEVDTAKTALPIRVIELAGLPGTGKSTIARCLEDMLGRAGVPTISRAAAFEEERPFIKRQWKRFQLTVRQASNCGHLYHRSFRLIGNSGQRSLSDFAIVTSNLWAVLALMAEARKKPSQVLILDQGLLQALWSVQLWSSHILRLDAWAPLLLAAGAAETLLADVRTDLSVSCYRVAARGHRRPRLDCSDFENRSRRWQMASDKMSTLIEWARHTIPRDEHGERVLSIVNNKCTPEAAAAQIANAYFRRSVWKCDRLTRAEVTRPPMENRSNLGDPAEAKRVQR
jgi:hypothetical protein